jgi:hypothetical protein
VYVCLTGERGPCRNAGEDDLLLGRARLIRRPGEIRCASRRRDGYVQAKGWLSLDRAESTPLFRVVISGPISRVFIPNGRRTADLTGARLSLA